jgi:hypothetical protein
MSYVPGQKHDLFFSYAHADNGAWLEAFQKTLCEGLNERLGSRVSVWQDEHNLRLGMNWKNEIREAICGAAAFLAVCSPSYFNSFWCRDERKLFLAHHNAEESLDPIRVGEVYRFLKIIKTPAENDLQFKFLPALQSVNFFCPAASDSETEFLPGTPEFRAKVKQAVLAVAALLRAMRRSREAIYVATAADDVADEWMALRNELQAQGFDVQPEALVDAGFDRQFLRDEIERANVAVFILGGEYDPFLESQIELALELRRPIVAWIHPAKSQAAGARQAALLQRFREDTEFPEGSQVLGGASVRDLIRDLLELLRPRPEPPALPQRNGELARVYLLFDPTTRSDREFAGELEILMRQRQMTVFKPELSFAAHSDQLQRHEQFLRECDGVLLYRDGAPPQWLEQTLPDVLLAEFRLHRPPLSAKTCLVTDPLSLQGLRGLQVIRRSDPFDPAHLQPFFAEMEKASHAYAN